MSFSYEPIDRTPYVRDPRTIVVKFGTEVVTDGNRLNYEVMNRKMGEIVGMRENGVNIVIITSGAIATGASRMGRSTRGLSMDEKQGYAGVGQPKLMGVYEEMLKYNGSDSAVMQILPLSEDFSTKDRVINMRRMIRFAFQNDMLPIVNANDVLSQEEIEKYDNDTLGAKTAVAIGADLMVTCMAGRRNGGDVEYFYDGDPNIESSRPIRIVYAIDSEMKGFVVERPGDIITRGGYASKLAAGEILMPAGMPLVTAHVKYPIGDIASGEDIGTLYVPKGEKLVTLDMDDAKAFDLMQELFAGIRT